VPAALVKFPTAVHADADAHDTPSRLLPAAPFGLGVLWIAQLVPFHRSARVACAPAPLVKLPTATHADADVQDTAESWPS
jgi:hypothetical protein